MLSDDAGKKKNNSGRKKSGKANNNKNKNNKSSKEKKDSGFFSFLKKKEEPKKDIVTKAAAPSAKSNGGKQSLNKAAKEGKSAPEPKEKQPKEELLSPLEVNLMPEELVAIPREEAKNKVWLLVFIIFISIFLITLFYIGLTWYELRINNQIKNIDLKINKIEKEIAEREQGKEEILALQRKLKAIEGLFENHIFWTDFFALLEKYTIPEVYFSNFSSDIEGSVVLSATTDSYKNVARQLVALEAADDFAENVYITSASAQVLAVTEEGTQKAVNFDVRIDLVKDLFYKFKPEEE